MTKFPDFNQHQVPEPLDYGQFDEFILDDPLDVTGSTANLPDRIISMVGQSEQGLSIGEVVDILTDTQPGDLPPRNAEWVAGIVRPLMSAMITSGELVATPVFVAAHTKGHPTKKGDRMDIIGGENRLRVNIS